MDRAVLVRTIPRQRMLAILAACGVVAMALMVSPAAAGAAAPGILPPQASVGGRTYSQWSAAWWQWQLGSQNVPTNPSADPKPGTSAQPEAVDCHLGQTGQVWFLAGISFAQSFTTTYRSCSVPAGVFLFFPVFDAWNDNLNCPGLPPLPNTARQLAQNVRQQVDAIDPGTMSVTIDGANVPGLRDSSTAFRAAARGFSYTLPDNNLLSPFCATPFPAGTTPPRPGAFADGVYVLRAPLPVGVHQLHWTAQAGKGAIVQDVNYTITVRG